LFETLQALNLQNRALQETQEALKGVVATLLADFLAVILPQGLR
jgi:hypothetical protein